MKPEERQRGWVESPSPEGIDLTGDAFDPLPFSARLALTLGPVVGFGLIISLTGLLVSRGAAGFVASMALGTFVGGGKLVILAGAVDRAPVGPWALAALIIYIDLATSMIVLGGMHYLYRLPAAGRRIAAARESGWRLLQRHPWMYHGAWLSLAGFVAVPFHGTGAFVGAAMGRLLGLSRVSIVMATGFGSLLGSSALALAGDFWEERISRVATQPQYGIVVLVVILGLMTLISRLALHRSVGKCPKDGQGDVK